MPRVENGVDKNTYLPALEHYRKLKLDEINSKYEEEMNKVGSYPEAEKLLFDKQEQEARAYIADSSAETPLLDNIVAARQIDKDKLVKKIIEKSDEAASKKGYLTGQRQNYKDELEKKNSIEDIEKMQIKYLFPDD